MNEVALVLKCQKVYDSCETKEQYKVAFNYFKLARRKVNPGNNWITISNLLIQAGKMSGRFKNYFNFSW
jgi:hypothetical protein